jgi:hypothetical protein
MGARADGRHRRGAQQGFHKEISVNTVAEKEVQDARIVVPDAPYSKREEVAAPASQPANLMQALAIAAADPRMDVSKVKELWAMHKEMMDRAASEAFNDAMSRAQTNIQPIAKDRRNDHTKSWYATLAAINDAITPIYSAEGLAVSFDTYTPERDAQGKEIDPPAQGWHRVIAIVSHKGGHSRRYHLDAPLDDAGKDGTKNKTGIQAMGSTVSYLRRYLSCMIFNVATADDNDGNNAGGGADGKRMEEKVLADHLAAIDGSGDEPELLKTFGKAWNAAEDLKDKDAQRQLIQHRDVRRKTLREKGRRS